MDLYDVIKELREGRPDIEKTEKVMKVLGWICVVGAIWHFAIYYIEPVKANSLSLLSQYPYVVLFGLLFLGALFFRSSLGIKELKSWGKKTGQVGIIFLIGIFWGFMFFVFPSAVDPIHNITISTVFIILIALTFSQFAISAFFSVRYIGRLPVKDDNDEAGRQRRENRAQILAENNQREKTAPNIQYKDSLVPLGIFGTFTLIMVGPLLGMPIIEKYGGQQIMPYIFIPYFLLTFLGPLIYNIFPSPFEKERNIVASYTGGGSIFLFYWTWPFIKLNVYDDGLEIRIMFQRYFIPYDKMDDIPDQGDFFNRGILIKSDLQDVPYGIRFIGFGMKNMLKVVKETRNKYRLSINRLPVS